MERYFRGSERRRWKEVDGMVFGAEMRGGDAGRERVAGSAVGQVEQCRTEWIAFGRREVLQGWD
jgi:hypothetical protein